MNLEEIRQRADDEYEQLIGRPRPWVHCDCEDMRPALNQAIEDVRNLIDEIEYLRVAARGF